VRFAGVSLTRSVPLRPSRACGERPQDAAYSTEEDNVLVGAYKRVLRSVEAVLERYGKLLLGLAAALLVVVSLFPGLGTPGLWDPWEMDRAHVARHMAGPTVAVVLEARAADDSFGRIGAHIEEQYPADYLILSSAVGRDTGVRGVPLVFRRAHEILAERPVQLMALDLAGLLADPHDAAALSQVASGVRKAMALRPTLEVVLFAPPDVDPETLSRGLFAANLRAALAAGDAPAEAAAKGAAAAAEADAEGEEPTAAVAERVAQASTEATGEILWQVFAGPDDASFGRLLSATRGRQRARAEVRVDDVTYALPALDFQLTALSFRLFGVTEWSARLPSLLWGLLALLALAAVAHRLYGFHVAMVAVIVLASTPLFVAQARHVSGDSSFSATLTAAVGAFFILARFGWSYRWGAVWVVATLLAFLGNGLTAVLFIWAIMAAYAAVVAERRLSIWLPLAGLSAFFGLAVLVVLSAADGSFFAQFKFMDRPFQGGPIRDIRNFDYFVRQIGFGMFPWSALLPFAFGRLWLAPSGAAEQPASDESASARAPANGAGRRATDLGLLLWFALPFGLIALMLKDFSHAVYPGIPVIALALAVLLTNLGKGGYPRGFLAFGAFLLLFIIVRQLGQTPEPLTAGIAYDPHFAEDANVFPEVVQISRTVKYLAVFAGLALLVFGFRIGGMLRRGAALFRQPAPFWTALYALAAVLVVLLFTFSLLHIDATLSRPEARGLQPGERLFAIRTMGGVLAIVSYVCVALAFVVHLFAYSAWGTAARQRWRLFRLFGRVADRVSQPVYLAVTTGVGVALLASLFAVLAAGAHNTFGEVLPDSFDGFFRGLFFGNRFVLLLVGLMAALVVNRVWREPYRRFATVFRGLELFERPRVVVTVFTLMAVVFTLSASRTIFAELALHVSQKHVVETYLAAEGRADLGDNIFKHGRFTNAGQGDSNFYTNQIPEVSDQRAVVAALRRQEDVVLTLAPGSAARDREAVLVRGFDPANDRDGDGVRDWPAYGGIATDVGPSSLEDLTANWALTGWKGYRLHLAERGQEFAITDNTATRLELVGTPRLGRTPALRRYSIDWPAAAVPQATSMRRDERVYFLLPKLPFSALNHEFRKVSGGAPIALLDARSSRLVLAVSHLLPGEVDQNWIAAALTTAEELETRDWFPESPGSVVRRVRANWDDKIEIIGYVMESERVARRQRYRIKMFFRSIAPVNVSYKIFMHVDRAGSSHRIHSDHWPLNLESAPGDDPQKTCRGCFDTRHWMPGDIYVNSYEREVPLGTPAGAQDIWLGFFSPPDGARLPIKDFDEATVTHDGQNRVRIGAFDVH
jgi:4-amino-4-deoxy-L-arabinose transferase-like glycosyltransferase